MLEGTSPTIDRVELAESMAVEGLTTVAAAADRLKFGGEQQDFQGTNVPDIEVSANASEKLVADGASAPYERPKGSRRDTRTFRMRLLGSAGDWGWKRAMHSIVMNVLARTLGFHLHYVTVGVGRDDLADPNPPVIPPGYTVRLVGLADLLPYVGRVPNLSREFLEEAFAYDDECGAAFCGDELVSFSFNKRSRTVVTDQLDVLIPPGFRYSYKAWTHPDHTRRNLQKATGFVRRAGPKRTFGERVISYVETHNYPSLLHGYQHPNKRELFMGYVGWITVFGRQIPFSSRQARKIGFEFVRKSDPGLRQYVR